MVTHAGGDDMQFDAFFDSIVDSLSGVQASAGGDENLADRVSALEAKLAELDAAKMKKTRAPGRGDWLPKTNGHRTIYADLLAINEKRSWFKNNIEFLSFLASLCIELS